MKIGKRTQAYFIGFLIGTAVVSILIDSRRERQLEREVSTYTWVRSVVNEDKLPEEVIRFRGDDGYVTVVKQNDSDGNATQLQGYFFANSEGKKYWLLGKPGAMKAYSGELLDVVSRPGLEGELMKAGFEHQGHSIVSDLADAPNYRIQIDVHSASTMIDAYKNLLSKTNYISEVNWIEME